MSMRDDLWCLEEQLMSASSIVCSTSSIPIDGELKRALYKAVKPVLVKRIRASYAVSLPLPLPSSASDALPLDSASDVELTSDTVPAVKSPVGKRPKS